MTYIPIDQEDVFEIMLDIEKLESEQSVDYFSDSCPPERDPIKISMDLGQEIQECIWMSSPP